VLRQIPLLIVPFILYNLALIGVLGSAGDPWRDEIFSIAMLSGGIWTMTLGDILVVVALVLLFVEIVKSTGTSNASIVDHILSTALFVAFLIEFLRSRRRALRLLHHNGDLAGRRARRLHRLDPFRKPGRQSALGF